MSAVRPEFGPTLPELLGPHVRRLPRVVRLALAALLVVLVAAVAVRWLGGGEGDKHVVVVRQPTAFNFLYRAPFTKQPLARGELAKVGGAGQSFTVRDLRMPAYRGDVSGFFPVYASHLDDEMRRALPGYTWREEGRANVNKIQGYEILFHYRGRTGTVYGRRVLLLPSATARRGVDLLLLAQRSRSVSMVSSVGRNGALKTSLRSFRLGTERP